MLRVYSADGEPTAEIPVAAPYRQVRFDAAGDQLLLDPQGDDNEPSQRLDLTTGELSNSCPVKARPTVGTDGSVGLADDGNTVVAYELSSCRELWRLPAGSGNEIKQVGAALLNIGESGVAGYRAPD